jgi:hypothetical protein
MINPMAPAPKRLATNVATATSGERVQTYAPIANSNATTRDVATIATIHPLLLSTSGRVPSGKPEEGQPQPVYP